MAPISKKSPATQKSFGKSAQEIQMAFESYLKHHYGVSNVNLREKIPKHTITINAHPPLLREARNPAVRHAQRQRI